MLSNTGNIKSSSPKEQFINKTANWSWLVLLPTFTLVTILLAMSFGLFLVPTASWVDAAIFAGVVAVVVGLLFKITQISNIKVGLILTIIGTTSISLGGHIYLYQDVKTSLPISVENNKAIEPTNWESFYLLDVSEPQLQQLRSNTISGFWLHLKLMSSVGMWNFEGYSKKYNSEGKWVKRSGYGAWFGWFLQIVMVLIGHTIGVAWAAFTVSEKKELLWKNQLSSNSSLTRCIVKDTLNINNKTAIEKITIDLIKSSKWHESHSSPSTIDQNLVSLAKKYYSTYPWTKFNIPVYLYLLRATESLQQLKPQLTFYKATVQIYKTYKKMFPKDFHLPPFSTLQGNQLTYDANEVLINEAHPLLNQQNELYSNSDYINLTKQLPNEISHKDYVPLLYQALIISDRRGFEDSMVILPLDLLISISTPLYDSLLYVLLNPKIIKLENTHLELLFSITTLWPQSLSDPLFKMAFESGWNECSRYLPDTPWARKMLNNFSESPFGAPTRSNWR